MAGLFAVAGAIALSCLLLPLSGWWVPARLRLVSSSKSDIGSLTVLVVACLSGITILAIAELVIYALRLPQVVAAALVTASCAFSVGPLISSIRRREFAWDALLTWAGASAILAAATLPYAVHGFHGAFWDWYEHWLRSLVFLTQGPISTNFGPSFVAYIMAARGPLFNGAASFLLYLAGPAHYYWIFQIIATTFNVLICLPLALLLRTIGGLSRRNALLIAAAVSVLVPFYFLENTFTWTKDLTATFVLLGIHEYLAAYREGNRDRMAMALAYLAPGFLCHYLVLPYAVMLGLHLLIVVPVRALPLRALLRAALVWIVLIAPWFGFMMLNFGVRGTLAANTTVGTYYAAKDLQGHLIPQSKIFFLNLASDLFLRPVDAEPCKGVTVDGPSITPADEPCPSGLAWNSLSLKSNGIYRVLGYAGLLTVLMAAAVSLRPWLRRLRTSGAAQDAWFLLWVLGAGLLLNLLPIRWIDIGGSFGENLQAWFLVLVAVVVRGLRRLPRPLIAVLMLAMAAEFVLVDLTIIRTQSVVLPLPHSQAALEGHPPLGEWAPRPVSTGKFHVPVNHYLNYVVKVRGGAVYFRDTHPDSFGWIAWTIFALGLVAMAAGHCAPVEKRQRCSPALVTTTGV